jgi:hypothetical protein
MKAWSITLQLGSVKTMQRLLTVVKTNNQDGLEAACF